ncbi:MAG: CRTAC1 family protein [Planctomycetota bacterium]
MRFAFLTILLSIFLACAGDSKPASRPLEFNDAATSRKLGFVATCGTPAKVDIVETNGTGAAAADFDLDGDLDLFFAQGSTLDAINAGGGAAPELWLFDNQQFLKLTTETTLQKTLGWWTGVAAGDADGDGDIDIYLCGYLKSVYLRNDTSQNAAGVPTVKFTDATRAAGLEDYGWATGACWFDADGDADLDLYLVRYLELDPKRPPRGTVGSLHLPCAWRGLPVFCGPRGFVATPDRFFKNQGGGTFVESTGDSGFDTAPASYGLGVCPVDFDRDGDLDLYIANDSKANFLWRNDGGKFVECAFETGVGLGEDGSTYAGMGVAADDATGDGCPEIVVTNFSDEPVSVYKNRLKAAPGFVTFDNISATSGVGAETMATLKWGVDLADFDLDGDLDLFIANGHVYPQADSPNTGTQYKQQNQIFLNDGFGKFTLWRPSAGSPLLERRSHRALALLDFDDDGDCDILIIPVDGPAVLLENAAPLPSLGGRARARILLQSKSKNTEAIGASVTLAAGGILQTRDVRRAGSYASSRDPRLCFGLGSAAEIDKIEIRWPGGKTETIPGAGLVNCNITIVEGAGVVSKIPIRGAVK